MTFARAFNRAVDRGDDLTADLIAEYAQMSCRDLDRLVETMTSEEIEALLEAKPTNLGQGVYS